MKRRGVRRFSAQATGLVAVLAVVGFGPGLGTVAAHGPDPTVSGRLWAQDRVLTYQWWTGQVPPDWMGPAINAAAGDASYTRAARAATFSKTAGTSSSLIAYGEPTGCSSAGIACFDRSGAPNSFKMWFRAYGYVFDWGTLRWCQGQSTPTNGCFDVETIALDEFGHVEDLGHHVNLDDGSDYLDAVVQALSHARPAIGWAAHAFAPCDTARLQLLYDRLGARDPISTCLDIPTLMTLTATRTSAYLGETIEVTATLRTTSASSNGALANDPLTWRSVVLQRRSIGSTTWTTIGSMPQGSTEGTYVLTISPTATYDWRASFTPASTDGALASSSAPLRITMSGCTGSGCPSRHVP